MMKHESGDWKLAMMAGDREQRAQSGAWKDAECRSRGVMRERDRICHIL